MATIFRAPIITRLGVVPPSRSVLDSEGSVWQNPLVSVLKGQDTFYGAAGQVPNYDWQNPRLPIPTPRGFTAGVNLNLLGQDQFFGLVGNPTYDFPNPRGPQFPVALRSADNNLLETTLTIVVAAPFQQLDWPLPRRAVMPIGLRQTTDFVSSSDAPFAMADWPVPRGPADSVSRRHAANNLLESTLGIVVAAPFSMLDWPVPAGAKGSIALRTWADPTKLNLLGQDQLFGAAGEVPAYDWQNPRGPRSPIQLRHHSDNLLLTTLSIVFPMPFNVFDWPVPKGPVPSTSLKTWTEPLKLELLGQDQFFAAAGMAPTYDYPNPRGYAYPTSLRHWDSNQIYTTLQLLNPVPYNQYDWPVPKGYVPATSLKTWTDNSKIQLIGQDTFFAAAGMGPTYDWPNPVRAKRVQIAPVWRAPLSVILVQPFALTDWPVPKTRQGSVSLRTWTWGQSIIATITPTEIPGFIEVDERLVITRSTDNRMSITRSTDNRTEL